MSKSVFLIPILFLGFSARIFATSSPLTFDWKGTSSTWESSGSWTETGGSGDYPGSGSRTTDIVRFGVTGTTFTLQPTLTTTLTIASIEFGGSIELIGTQVTVNGATLTVGTITQDINTTPSINTIFDYLQGTGTIMCTNVVVGSTTNITGTFNFMMSDIANLYVAGNVTVISNVNKAQGSGFRLENGNMYLTGQIIFTQLSGITASNASYFTINTHIQAVPQTATTPHLYLLSPTPIPSIPTPHASVNFYGDHGGTSTVTYQAANPTITTTSTGGFGTGGGNIDTTQASYDYLTVNASGTATVGAGSTLGALKVAADLTTQSPTTFNTTAGTNTSVGGNWINSTTITGGTGSTAITGNITNSGTMNMASGILEVGGNVSNTATFNAGSGNISVDGNVSNSLNLTLSTGSIYMAGNYTNSAGATFKAGTGQVYFNSTDAQTLTDNSTGGTIFNYVNFTNGGAKTMTGTGSFGLSATGQLTMAASNTLATGGLLTLYSTSASTASIEFIPSTASITGNVKMQRYISGGSNAYRGYRFLSSSVYTAKTGTTTISYYYDLSYLPSYTPTTGTLGVSGGMTQTGNPSIYLYRDNVLFTNKTFNSGNFRGVNKINNTTLYNIGVDGDGTDALHPGTGFMLFYRGDLTNLSNKFKTTTSAESNVFVQTGVLNQQAVTVTNWFTQAATLQYDVVTGNATGYAGYNLVGNPYASSIDWNTYSTKTSSAGIYAPGVGPTIWIYNEESKIYATYSAGVGANGGTNVIPSGQGFFVQASVNTATLTFNELAKTNSQVTGPTQPTGNTLLLDAMPVAAASAPQYLRLEMAADSMNKEETIVRFSSAAKNEYDINEDAQHMTGSGILSFSSMSSDNHSLAINNMPFPKQQQTAVKLNVSATSSGIYKLNLTQVANIPQLFDVWLMDNYTKDSLDIKHNPTYAFNVLLSDTNTFGGNRFELVIRQNPALGVHLLNFTATKETTGAKIVWKTENEDNYTQFAVERSTDNAATFNAIDTLTSSNVGNYGFSDPNPAMAANMYRLKLTDLNGAVTYSKVITLNYKTITNSVADNNISIYPNPAASVINLSITPAAGAAYSLPTLQTTASAPYSFASTASSSGLTYDIKIVNLTGAVIKSATSKTPTWQENISTLVPGTYLIEVVNNNDKSLVGKSRFVKL